MSQKWLTAFIDSSFLFNSSGPEMVLIYTSQVFFQHTMSVSYSRYICFTFSSACKLIVNSDKIVIFVNLTDRITITVLSLCQHKTLLLIICHSTYITLEWNFFPFKYQDITDIKRKRGWSLSLTQNYKPKVHAIHLSILHIYLCTI